MENYSSYSKNKKTSPKYMSLFYFLASNVVIALIYYFLVSGFVYPFTVGGEPAFSLSANLILWLTFCLTIIVGVVPFMELSLAKNTNRTGQRVTFVIYYIFLLMVLLWALFTFTLKLPVVGVIILGITIALGIYLAYRFLTRTIVGGVIFTLYLLYLIYIFVQNLAYVLLV